MSNDNAGDGLGGTDNVRALFSDRPTAAGLPAQPEVIEVLEKLLEEAKTGRVTGLCIVAFDPEEYTRVGTAGKVPFHRAVSELDGLKFELQLGNHFRVKQ